MLELEPDADQLTLFQPGAEDSAHPLLLICPLLENQQIYLSYIHCDETKSESWPVQILVSVLPELSKVRIN